MSCPVLDLPSDAERAGRDLEEATAEEVVAWAVDTFGERLCVTASMTDAVVIDLVSRARPAVDVLFLDTGYHFAETLGTRDAVAATYPVNLLSITPVSSVAEQDAEHGPRLFERDPDLCCAMRKVQPLERAMRQYDAWVTGLRRDESPNRRNTPVVGWDHNRGKVKVNPIARWTQDDVERYIVEHGILVNPLLQDGYASVGCAPCTRRVQPGEGVRDGRWSGLAKVECGLHA